MAASFVQTLQDETLRIEVGPTAVADLAVENLELSTPAVSRAVRRSVIERRVAAGPVMRMPGPNRLAMDEVALPDAA
jgi:hypothetical protein